MTSRMRSTARSIAAMARKRDLVLDPDLDPDHTAAPPPAAIGCHRALYVPEQLDRVQACGFRATLAGERAKLDADSFPARPLARYTLHDAVIAGGWIIAAGGRHFMQNMAALPALRGNFRRYETATLLNSEQGLKYFGHWLRDDCAVHETVRDRADLISMQRPAWADARAYARAFDQAWPDADQATTFAHIGTLTLLRELGFNRDKARRLRLLRDRLRAHHRAPNAGAVVFIRRGRGGAARAIANQDALEQALAAAGVIIIEPEQGAGALITQMLDAAVIITVEGSQASHGTYCLGDGGAMLILQPPDRFYNPHHEWARLLGMGYGITVGCARDTGFHIYPDEVFAMIDRLQTAPRIRDS